MGPVATTATDILGALSEAKEVRYSVDRYGYRVDKTFLRRVTTHLGGIPKPWLGGWAAKAAAEWAVANKADWLELPDDEAIAKIKGAPWAYRDERADRGAAVHAAVEAVVNGTPLPDGLDEDRLDCAIAVEVYLKARAPEQVLGTEVTVFNVTYGYAGTFDYWDLIRGECGLLDWKTSADVYPEAAIQLAAYRHAEHAIVGKVPVPGKTDCWTGTVIPWKPEYAAHMEVVHVTPEGCKAYPVLYSERMWEVFRGAKFLKEWIADTDSYRKRPKVQVFGEPNVYPVSEATDG